MLYTPSNWQIGDVLLDDSGLRLIPGRMKFKTVNTNTGEAEIYQLDDSGHVVVDAGGNPATMMLNLSRPLTVIPGGDNHAGTTRRTAEGGA